MVHTDNHNIGDIVQKFGVGENILFSLLCSPRLNLFDQKYSKNRIIVKYYYNLKYMFSTLIHFFI